MVSTELIKKIRKIEIKSNRIVEEIFSGEYRSVFQGKGMEFDEIREYYPGDDIRNIDWNVTARQNKAYIKKFHEERELNMFLLIDMSNSNSFAKKKDLIAEIGATLAFSAVKNNDKVGSILFTDKIEKMIPSRQGKKHVLSIIEDILRFQVNNKGTDIKKALQYLNKIQKRRSIVFLISDFIDQNYERELKITNQKHDLVLIRVIDPNEEKIPKGAIFEFEDLETGEKIVVDNLKQENRLNLKVKLPTRNLINIYTNEDFIKPLMLFFKRRMR
ncbi:DUF58 domain-containing protein [Orenia marismortui]|uniref:Uncharacterized protein DUF58 n=1 Tax=Orenia marismortui TaxID=46469 RepID=A0A4V3GYI5_9FIRM|nr:DUF58 domain-containing protein [Orenia marismortui]TDX52735.1 uncharacterized protein DUF58 [Orenia marismortui]